MRRMLAPAAARIHAALLLAGALLTMTMPAAAEPVLDDPSLA